jgi:DNA-binding IclR family transcriptional regulator
LYHANTSPTIPPPEGIASQDVQSVIAALENPQYKWRTIAGIAASTGLAEGQVRRILHYLEREGVAIQSSVDAEDGSALFTTRLHYREKASLWHRFLAALRNRPD